MSTLSSGCLSRRCTEKRGWYRDYSPSAWRSRATEEQKRVGWEMYVRMEKILCMVLQEAHEQQIEETMEVLSEGPESFYKSYLE
jgi:hypothetical protein